MLRLDTRLVGEAISAAMAAVLLDVASGVAGGGMLQFPLVEVMVVVIGVFGAAVMQVLSRVLMWVLVGMRTVARSRLLGRRRYKAGLLAGLAGLDSDACRATV